MCIDSIEDIALFKSMTMSWGTDNITWNILSFRLNVENILHDYVNPTLHCYGFVVWHQKR